MSAVDLDIHLETPGPALGEAEARPRGAARFTPSFRELYDEHVSMAWRGLLRLGVPEAVVEDAVQDVFVVVHRREGDFEARSSLRTWIYGIVVHVAKSYRRSAARRRSGLSEVERMSASPEPLVSPAEHTEQLEAARIVNRVLSTMPDAQREVLVLVELMGLSTSEAAEALGCSLRTTQRLLGRARAAFEALVAAHAQEESRNSGTRVIR